MIVLRDLCRTLNETLQLNLDRFYFDILRRMTSIYTLVFLFMIPLTTVALYQFPLMPLIKMPQNMPEKPAFITKTITLHVVKFAHNLTEGHKSSKKQKEIKRANKK
uniref:Uncharacterized protein n=1 Tax=Glossina brevipalpis TaxID=37001 RepID=A0A1A9W090_9MUSC